jgi:hypothetical protein
VILELCLDNRQGSGGRVQNTYGSEAILVKKLQILGHFHAYLTLKLVLYGIMYHS